MVVGGNRRIYTTSDRNLIWVKTADIPNEGSEGETYPIHIIGGKFVVARQLVSDDGTTWSRPTKIGSWYVPTPSVYFKGVYVSFPDANWSADGITWTPSTGGLGVSYPPAFAVTSDALHVRDASGAVWQTSDGKEWSRVRAGAANPTSTGEARHIVQFGDRLLASGTNGLLLFSEDDGRSWQPGLVDGRGLPSGILAKAIKTSPTEAFAVFTVDDNYEFPVLRHFRSQDGRSWTELPDMAALNVSDYAWDNDVWMATRFDGSMMRSGDGGVTWENIASVPAGRFVGSLSHFAGLWVTASIGSTSGGLVQIHTSADGSTWTHRADVGAYAGGIRDISSFFTGHSYLHYGTKPYPSQSRSADGITWTLMAKVGSTTDVYGTNARIYVPMTGGYTALAFSNSYTSYWTAPVDGGKWNQALLQNQITWLGTPDGERLFLFGPGIIKEWTTNDLELSVSDSPPAVAGVGDSITAGATLLNLGAAAATGPIEIHAWLSTDRFFGDGNDVYVGSSPWNGAVPNPGKATTQNLKFTLPDIVRPGSHYLILEMSVPESFREANRANNVAMTGGTALTIPQRKLNVTAAGNGTVSSDQNAEYHPHGARIAMVANPGKGARFAGWGGDAVGAFSETLVIMNSDKNISANFVSTAALTVFTRGGGTVTQSVDDGIYVSGTSAGLTAVPLPGWTFEGWSGALDGGDNSRSIVMDFNKVVTARFSLTFEAWQTLHFRTAELANPSISGYNVDADGDGFENWREWLRGSDPHKRGSLGQSQPRLIGNWLVMTYSRLENPPSGHGVRASASQDLRSWLLPFDERVIDSADGVETIEARVNMTGRPRVFFRLSDMRPQP